MDNLLMDLDNDITCKRAALILHLPGDPERHRILTEISDSLYDRTKLAYSPTHLDEAITLGREALRLCPPGHSDRPPSLHKLARYLLSRFKRENSPQNLEEAITLARDALQLCPPGHASKASSLDAVAQCLFEQFKIEHRTEDLQNAITMGREALELRPSGHPDRSASLHNLAMYLARRFNKDDQLNDLEEAVTLARASIELRPLGHPERHYSLHDLANYLTVRHLKIQEAATLDALKLVQAGLTESLDQLKSSLPSPILRHVLSGLADRNHKDCRTEDIASSMISGGPDKTHCFHHCSVLHSSKSNKENNIGNPNGIGITSIRTRLSGHPNSNQPSSTSLALQLVNNFDKGGRTDNMKDETPRSPSHPKGQLHDLASSFCEKYGRECNRTDLDEAISFARDALDLRPPDHPDRTSSLQSLAQSLAHRFDRDGRINDITEAIGFVRTAVTLQSSGHSRWHSSVNKLLDYLRKRYHKAKAVADLEEMIALRRDKLKFRPQDHPERSCLLESLEDDITEMIDKPHTEVDLDKAISLGQEILAIGLSCHPRRSKCLKKLINCIEERFQKQGAISDLDELARLHQNIIELQPPNDPARSSFLHGLAHCHWRRFQKQGEVSDLEEAVTTERAALDIRQQGHADRAESLYTLVGFLGEYRQAGKAIDFGELIVLGCFILELGQSEHPDHATSLRNLARWASDHSCKEDPTVNIQDVITLMTSALRLPVPHHDRLPLLKALAIYRRQKLKMGTKADPEGIKKLVRDVVYDYLQNLPTRLLNTLTGRLCRRDALILDFENSTQCKALLDSIADLDPSQRKEHTQSIVSAYFQYVTLSHRWGSDEPELRDVHGQVIYDMELTDGTIKLQFFCTAACERDYMWAWSDTCCIDKNSSAEVQEAIGRMFDWYRWSAMTFVHLADVSDDGVLANSVWFKRGWTLQELLAPRTILFFTQDWSPYGGRDSSNHKEDSVVLAELAKVTNIAPHHLTDFYRKIDLDARSILHWASTRCTTRQEDMAYSLFGLFNLHLPVIYGELEENALRRLLTEIISHSGDISVFDWVGEASTYHSCFPAHIATYQTDLHADQRRSPTLKVRGQSKALNALFKSLSTSDTPQFKNSRLKLPCIEHRVKTIQQKESQTGSSGYVYEIRAKGLTPSKLVLSNAFPNDLSNKYVLIRPWRSAMLNSSEQGDATAAEKLAMELAEPFHALLLEELPQHKYRRVASSAPIIARPADADSLLRSQVQTITII